MRMLLQFINRFAPAGFCLIYFLTAHATGALKPLLNIQKWQTPQGTPVYFVKTSQLPITDIQVIFTAGSAYDDKTWGLAEFVANSLSTGTKQHNVDQIANAFEQVGAQFGSDADRDIAVVSLRSLSDPSYLTPAFQMFSEVLGSASFPSKDIERIKQQTLSAIQQQQQDPAAVASNTFYKALYSNHPYNHPMIGRPEKIKALSRGDIQNFYKHYYVAKNAKIVIVGDLERGQAEKMANQLMAALPSGQSATVLPQANEALKEGTQAVFFPSQQTTIMLGQYGINRQNSEYFPLLVGNYLLGQMPLGSLLFQQVRNERGLVYGVYSAMPPMSYRGPFAIVLKTRTSEKDQALQVTHQVLQQYVTNGPTIPQLEMAKETIINNFPLNLATNEDIVDTLTKIAVNQWPLDYLDTFRDKVGAVTIEEVKKNFQQLIMPDKMITITVGQ